jgi:hypothetical protein
LLLNLYSCFIYILTGTFQKVDFVFLVGVGGGVPHYTDYTKHVRLGDVVVSHAMSPNKLVPNFVWKYLYLFCLEK